MLNGIDVTIIAQIIIKISKYFLSFILLYINKEINVMKHIKKFESFSTEGSLKERLTIHYQENESEFDPEETENVLEILGHYDDSLTRLSKWDKVFLLDRK